MKKQKERHKLARATVDVYRLFKVRDLGLLLRRSSDPVVAEIGIRTYSEASTMLKPYMDEQDAIDERGKK